MHVTHHQAQEDLLSREVGNLPGGGAVNRAYHLDAQGSVAAVTDAAQSTVTRYQTDAWGNVLSGAIADEPAIYGGGLGYWYDPDLALYYVKARWLNPVTGRPEHPAGTGARVAKWGSYRASGPRRRSADAPPASERKPVCPSAASSDARRRLRTPRAHTSR